MENINANRVFAVDFVSSNSNFSSFTKSVNACSSPVPYRRGGQLNKSNNICIKYAIENYNLIVLFIIITIIAITLKMVIVSAPYTNTESFIELKSNAQNLYYETIKWASQEKGIIQPIFYGLAIAVFGYMLMYLDSNIPGEYPPTPFSPRKKLHYYQQRSSLHLGYVLSIFTGLFLGILMYLDI